MKFKFLHSKEASDVEQIYQKIWELAKPYYEKGRPMDIDHIEWMMHAAVFVCEREGLDESLLLPLVILHDVGYAEVPKDNPFKLDMRKAHMAAGARIAHGILKEVDYPEGKISKIIHYVSVHDDWAFGEDQIYKSDTVLGSFNDLDFMWMATPKGFPHLLKILDKTPKEMIDYLENDEKLTRRPFSTKTTKDLFDGYMKDRKKELQGTKEKRK